MWFNDIDIELRHRSRPRQSESIAAGRYQVARDRYLERKMRWAMEQRRQVRGAWPGVRGVWKAAPAIVLTLLGRLKAYAARERSRLRGAAAMTRP